MQKTDILIIGGGPAGIVSALTAKKNYPNKKIILVREAKKAVIPCGIPYIFNRLKSVNQNLIADKPLIDSKVKLIIDKCEKLNFKKKTAELKAGRVIKYNKLILATGSKSTQVPILGAELSGVWQIKKDPRHLVKMRKSFVSAKNVVIIGGGYIGVEVAEELSRIKKLKVSIIEMGTHCLGTTLDKEFAVLAEEKLKSRGVKIYTQAKVKKITGNQKVSSVELSDGTKIKADQVLISIGARPNLDIVSSTDIIANEKSGIWVDEYMRTNIKDVFAVGDCVQKKDYFTRKNVPVMLASTACAEARIAGANLYKLKVLRENKGTLGSFSTRIGDTVIGVAGLTEKMAKKEKFDIVVGNSEAASHHPGALPGSQPVKVKLIFAKSSEKLLLGGEIAGPLSASEMVNILAMSIQQNVSAYDFNTAQISTHPLITPSPTCYSLIGAAQMAIRN